MQGVLPRDAVAALLASGGDAEEAMGLALEWQSRGGVSVLTEQSDPEVAAKLDVWAGMAESQLVLERFSKSSSR